MQLTFKLTRRDFYDAVVAHRNKTFRKWVYLSLALSNFALGIYSFAESTEASVVVRSMPIILIAVFWAYVFWGHPWLSARKQYLKQPAAQSRRTVTFDEAGTHQRWNGSSTDVTWSNYTRLLESERSLLLFSSPVCCSLIPKRVLTPEQIAELRKLFEEHHIPKGR